jgi:hypothetical protein
MADAPRVLSKKIFVGLAEKVDTFCLLSHQVGLTK